MRGQTALWRSTYSSIRAGSTCSWKPTRCISVPFGGCEPGPEAGPAWRLLEGEVADVVLGEGVRVAQQNDAVRADRVRAELACVERVALGAGNGALDERLRGVRGQVARVSRVPQRERGDGAVID